LTKVESSGGLWRFSERPRHQIDVHRYKEVHVRRFVLYRKEDPTGISGTGVVAEGVEFGDGVAVMRWLTAVRSTALYNSVMELILIHGHNGQTALLYIDAEGESWNEMTRP
jgi:hypothetical protein